MNYAQVLGKLNGRVSRKVGQHTYLRMFAFGVGPTNARIGLVFHDHEILTWWPDGRVMLFSHGWRSAVLRRRFNQWLPTPYKVITSWSKDSLTDFWLSTGSITRCLAFTDGMTIQTKQEVAPCE